MRSPSESAERQRADYQRQKEKLRQRGETADVVDAQKRCFKCQKIKPLNEFYAHPQMADGRLGKCKECTRRDTKQRALDKRQAIREYMAWKFQTESGKRQAIEAQRRRRARHPEKYQARQRLANAVRAGRVFRLPCIICGDPNSQGHHADYTKPFEVQWLCFKHHREVAHGQRVG